MGDFAKLCGSSLPAYPAVSWPVTYRPIIHLRTRLLHHLDSPSPQPLPSRTTNLGRIQRQQPLWQFPLQHLHDGQTAWNGNQSRHRRTTLSHRHSQPAPRSSSRACRPHVWCPTLCCRETETTLVGPFFLLEGRAEGEGEDRGAVAFIPPHTYHNRDSSAPLPTSASKRLGVLNV